MSLKNIDIRDAFFDTILSHARKNKNIIVLSADMDAFSLQTLQKELPKQYLNVGVSEQNMINIAAGLALSGKIVFCYSIASFATMRCYEQIKVNICSMRLPVTIIGAGAGFSFGYDGPTHHGHQDLSSMRLLPEMNIIEISSNDLAVGAVEHVINSKSSPYYIRLDKGPFPDWSNIKSNFLKGYRVLRTLSKTNIITNGFMSQTVCNAVDELKKIGKNFGVIDLFRVKPITNSFIEEILKKSNKIIAVEESCVSGGVATLLSETISSYNLKCDLLKIGAPDKQFIEYGSREWFHKKYKLDVDGIFSFLRKN